MDATIQQAPVSIKNKDKKRDLEMKSTKKGNNYYFAAKHHIGVDTESGAVVKMTTASANVFEITEAVNCFKETRENTISFYEKVVFFHVSLMAPNHCYRRYIQS